MIGAGAVILPGVEIGENAQVAANSLVAVDVPAETTVAGVPATPTDDQSG
jgi:acetyltransferase-like isoleucine patch superfamily enzyme